MTQTLYESEYDSLPREGQVYYSNGFPIFSYYLICISEQYSKLAELDSNYKWTVPLVNLCAYGTLDHIQTLLQAMINL